MTNYGQGFSSTEDDEENPGTNVAAQWSPFKSTPVQANNARDINPASKAVLDSLRARRFQDTAGWLNSLVGQQAPVKSSDRYQECDAETRAMFEWADQLFDKLDRFTVRFNNSALGTNLVVSCQRPEYKQKKVDCAEEDAVVFDGHITTAQWAMAIRGRKTRVEFLILPASRLLAFTSNTFTERDYPPFMELQVSFTDGQLSVSFRNQVITAELIEPLAKELFGDLVRVAGGSMSESELYAHPTTELKLGETVAMGYQAADSNVQAAQATGNQTTASQQPDAPAASAPDQVPAACTTFMQALSSAFNATMLEKENAEKAFDMSLASGLNAKLTALGNLSKQVSDAINQYTSSVK
jgi:hypothetical protein